MALIPLPSLQLYAPSQLHVTLTAPAAQRQMAIDWKRYGRKGMISNHPSIHPSGYTATADVDMHSFSTQFRRESESSAMSMDRWSHLKSIAFDILPEVSCELWPGDLCYSAKPAAQLWRHRHRLLEAVGSFGFAILPFPLWLLCTWF